MAISLYDVSVGSYLQTLGAVSHFLEKAAKHFREQGVDPNDVLDVRLYPDMLPFHYQIHSVVHHSVGAIESLTTGTFRPAAQHPHHDYAGLQAHLQEAQAKLQKLTPDEIDAREGAEVSFQAGPNTLRFTAANFILSFSQPNFHFHATTAYDILRSKGVPLGKRDYMGRVRMKR